jgi:hypothetical protein
MMPLFHTRCTALINIGRLFYIIFNPFERQFLAGNANNHNPTERQRQFLYQLEERCRRLMDQQPYLFISNDEDDEQPTCSLHQEILRTYQRTHERVLVQLRDLEATIKFQEDRIRDGGGVASNTYAMLAGWKAQADCLRGILDSKD